MSITLTISGRKSLLQSHFQPPLCLDDAYECGLLYFSALNSITNINDKNNIFAYGEREQLKLPYGTYDLYDIVDYLESNIKDCEINIQANNNTLKCSLYCTKNVNFNVDNSIGPTLGFRKTNLEANKWHESLDSVNILSPSMIRIECDLVHGSYNNGEPSHTVYEFIPNVPPGHRFIEVPNNIIYLPVNKKCISSIIVKVVDEWGKYLDFKDELIQLRLHLKQTK